MKKIIILIDICYMTVMIASESASADRLKNIFDVEVQAYYKKRNSELKSWEPEGSRQRQRQDEFILKARQNNESMKYYFIFLSAQAVGALFQRAYMTNKEQNIWCVTFNPTETDTVVFDSLHLPETFKYYLKTRS